MDPALLVSTILQLSEGKPVPFEQVEKVADHLCEMVDPKAGRISIKIGETTIWCNNVSPEVVEPEPRS